MRACKQGGGTSHKGLLNAFALQNNKSLTAEVAGRD